MIRSEYVRRRGYDPRIIPAGDAGPVPPSHFPVFIPRDFEPSDSDGDGPDIRWDRKLCKGQDPADGYRPRWGGGFFAPRGRHLHAAVDIMAAEGAYVQAPADGTIPEAVWIKGKKVPGCGFSERGGNYVFLVDAHGWEWYFSHLRGWPPWGAGDEVWAGSPLGHVGRTGNAKRKYGDGGTRGCPHLHLRVGKQLWRPGIARKYDVQTLLRPLYDAGAWHP